MSCTSASTTCIPNRPRCTLNLQMHNKIYHDYLTEPHINLVIGMHREATHRAHINVHNACRHNINVQSSHIQTYTEQPHPTYTAQPHTCMHTHVHVQSSYTPTGLTHTCMLRAATHTHTRRADKKTHSTCTECTVHSLMHTSY
jgi:hypothetical protein